MCSQRYRVWEKREVKSARTMVTAVFLTPPEHIPTTFVVMAIAQASVSHISTLQTELTELYYVNGC